MKAQILGFSIKHHNPLQAQVLKALINYDCPCTGCRKFFANGRRSTNEIMKEIAELRMISPEDEAKRQQLFKELRDNTTSLNQ